MAFVPRAHRGKVEETLREAQRVIFAYVAGNVMTSIFATLVVASPCRCCRCRRRCCWR